jgi:hypothetical protein
VDHGYRQTMHLARVNEEREGTSDMRLKHSCHSMHLVGLHCLRQSSPDRRRRSQRYQP